MVLRIRVYPSGFKTEEPGVLGETSVPSSHVPPAMATVVADGETMLPICPICEKYVPTGECAFIRIGTTASGYYSSDKEKEKPVVKAHRECVRV